MLYYYYPARSYDLLSLVEQRQKLHGPPLIIWGICKDHIKGQLPADKPGQSPSHIPAKQIEPFLPGKSIPDLMTSGPDTFNGIHVRGALN